MVYLEIKGPIVSEGASHHVHFIAEIEREEGQSGNAQGQAHHLKLDVQRCIAWCCALPALEHGVRCLGHQPTEASQPFAVEG